MRRILPTLLVSIAMFCVCGSISAQVNPYKVINTVKVGGEGGFDYLTADSIDRRLYIARSGQGGRLTIFNLDTLAPAGEIANVSAHGAVVDVKTGHGFASSNPVAMFDAKTATLIKTIPAEGSPDGYLDDPYNNRVYIWSHRAPNATVLNAKDGSILGTLDLGGAPEQAVTDGKGHIYVDLEDKASIAVIDARNMKVTGTYSLEGKGDGCAGLAIDTKNNILFAACRNPQVMVILSATDGKVITTLPIGTGCDGAVFNQATMEAFSSQGDGTLTIIKENSQTSFVVEQTVQTPIRAKTITLDTRTGHLLLMTAEYGPAPVPAATAAPGTRPARPPMIPGSFMIVVVGK
jgi:DNA-binding beta-propeller fold protein YncE